MRCMLISCLLAGAIDSENGRYTRMPSRLDSPDYTWVKLLDKAPWKKSYNFQMFSQQDTLWVLHHEGTWFSKDGKSWKKSQLPNAISNQAFLDYVQFQKAILGLGHFEGNIERFTLTTDIYQTRNMKNWQVVAKSSNLPKRFFYHPFVFQGKLWIIGGEDSRTPFADIWNSPDGIHWQQVKDHLPFGKRSNSQVVTLGNRLYLLNNDVWSSEDGLNWRLETLEIVKGVEVFGYSAVVLNGQIWLLGCNRNGQFSSQVLVSSDGRTWRTQQAPWSARGGVAACVHRGKIYLTGGKYGGQDPNHPEFVYSNDVWALEPN